MKHEQILFNDPVNVAIVFSFLSRFSSYASHHAAGGNADLASAAMICGVLFSISSMTDDMLTTNFFHMAFFYSGLLIQLYSNCYYGNQVSVLVCMSL